MKKPIVKAMYTTDGCYVPHVDGVNTKRAYEEMMDALIKIVEMNRQQAKDQYGDADKAETWSCVVVAKKALEKAGVEL